MLRPTADTIDEGENPPKIVVCLDAVNFKDSYTDLLHNNLK